MHLPVRRGPGKLGIAAVQYWAGVKEEMGGVCEVSTVLTLPSLAGAAATDAEDYSVVTRRVAGMSVSLYVCLSDLH